MMRPGQKRLTLRVVAWVSAAVVVLLAATTALAEMPASRVTRQQIVASHAVPAPNGGYISAAECISGDVSTVNPRWAAVVLTNTPSCVARFGGATGAAILVNRQTADSTTWRRSGELGDTCSGTQAGAGLPVLLDLGCRSVIPPLGGRSCGSYDLGYAGGYTDIHVAGATCATARHLLSSALPPGWHTLSGPIVDHQLGLLTFWKGGIAITSRPTD